MMRRNRGEHGSGLIEFIFVAPIILLLAGSTLEVARFLRFRQIAGVLSQEAANRAYSQCADITSVSAAGTSLTVNTTTTTTNISACLTTVKTGIDAAADAAGLAGSALTISVYRHNLGTVAPTNPMGCASSTAAVTRILSAVPASNFKPTTGGNTTGGEITTTSNALVVSKLDVCKRGRIVIAELVFPYTTIINYRVFGLGFNTDLSSSELKSTNLRETTIL
ncbi:MAG: pilus assembly protein [Proteobacteria bacterium]|nr:pilus assembly protein [Pseudomonadota bacterium]